jgi:hypothetical protein
MRGELLVVVREFGQHIKIGKEGHAFMNSKNEIDAEELRQLVNLFANNGYLREVRTDSIAADGRNTTLRYC